MSQSEISRFQPPATPKRDKNPLAADSARQKIAELPDQYLAHAAPSRENLVGTVKPVSPAEEGSGVGLRISAVGRPQAMPAPQPMPEPEAEKVPEKPDVKAEEAVVPGLTSTPKAKEKTSEVKKAPEPEAIEPKTVPAKPRRKGPSPLRPLLTGVATFIFLFLLFQAPILFNQLSYLTSKPETADTPAKPTVSAEPVLSIPKINVNAPIVFANSNIESAFQKDLESGVVHYANTAMPGEVGNSVIFGHSSNDWWEPGNYKFVFVLLDKIQVGDTFTANYGSTQYVYQVAEKKVVLPTDLSVTYPTPDPEMTLITCTPPGTSWKRLVVRAKQISPNPAVAKTSATTGNVGQALPGSAQSLTEQVGNWWKSVINFFQR